MSTFKRCPDEVKQLANSILCEFETHQPLLDARVTVDYVFAYPQLDEKSGEPVSDAITKNGVKALGLCRALPLKDRAMGRADAEITLDAYWWDSATEEERRALLDHELHHIAIKIDKRGLVRDDLGRPVLQLRKHDFEVGWFKAVAARHGIHSQERLQARQVMCDYGQYFWPEIAGEVSDADATKVTISTGGKSVETTLGGLKKAAAAVKK